MRERCQRATGPAAKEIGRDRASYRAGLRRNNGEKNGNRSVRKRRVKDKDRMEGEGEGGRESEKKREGRKGRGGV